MKGPKIMVFHIRQLLKTGAFVIAGVLVILLLIWVLTPKDKAVEGTTLNDALTAGSFGQESLYIPGSYSSYILLNDDPLFVTVTVDRNAITDIGLGDVEETTAQLYPLFQPVMETLRTDILVKQTTNVTPPAESEQTGKLLIEAINLALNQAYANVISTGL